MDRIAFRNTALATTSRIVFNDDLLQIVEYLAEDERLDITIEVDIDTTTEVQYDNREKIIKYNDDFTFTMNNFRMTHSPACMPEFFILMLMTITDMTKISSYVELFELYKSDNWYKQNIEICLTIDDELFFSEQIDKLRDNINYPERSILKCACGHNCKDINTIMIKNRKTRKQILVGCTCIEKTFDKDDCKLIKQRLRQSNNYIEYNRHLENYKAELEIARLQKEAEERLKKQIDATFRRCIKCNRQSILRTKPDWVKMCVGCYVDDKDKDIKGKCFIKLK